MPSGFECYDAAGNLTLSITDSIAKIVGSFDTQAGVAGSLTIPAALGGTRIFIVKNATPPYGLRSNNLARTQVTVSGMTISWTAGKDAMTVHYGVY